MSASQAPITSAMPVMAYQNWPLDRSRPQPLIRLRRPGSGTAMPSGPLVSWRSLFSTMATRMPKPSEATPR
ncbi:Uncharacterised protein [Bordetella pertussis]|nr:Uncharacterised protein [Bordetella pertussis]CFP65417.1 Uncharacterised protein [Bordetella pertussis]